MIRSYDDAGVSLRGSRADTQAQTRLRTSGGGGCWNNDPLLPHHVIKPACVPVTLTCSDLVAPEEKRSEPFALGVGNG
jgi:hypothetical protein